MQSPDQPLTRRLERACPAKINLRLAVVGRRQDGYHNLSSIVAPISIYDHLEVEWLPEDRPDELLIPNSHLEADASNLVSQALAAFRAAYPFAGHLKTVLRKSIPSGAGLGGGSSDAAGMLLLLQEMWGLPLKDEAVKRIATKLGADVPFFLQATTALMRGIGDELTPLPGLHRELKRSKLFIFKPSFGISTIWAYQALAKKSAYQDAEEESAFVTENQGSGSPFDRLPFNAFRCVVDRRYPTLPILLKNLNKSLGVTAEMSGSGSACFATFDSETTKLEMNRMVSDAWGENAFRKDARVV